ncbi:MAG TPA: ABC transporter ATP-binding protein [Acidimicrobiia bacterium]|nr:ABC transporter ATP-binding protein [Acidimicrobiia bacterium]
MGRVAVKGVTKRFADVTAVDHFTLEVADEEFLVLLGPSGCGKSTALRMIAGLEEPTEGTIEIGDRTVNDIEAKDRDVAMVFQSYALYPHMTVRRNVEFPLKSRKVPKLERDRLVEETTKMLGLEGLLERKPAQLSGGQRQRVALARAIVRRPQAFLMDEPLSNLDAKLRVQTRAELVELRRRLGATIVYVTHDQVEAMTMGDRIAILDQGVLQQVGPPQDVYARPANLFVARFIGNPPMNTVAGDVSRVDGTVGVQIPGGVIELPGTLGSAVERRGLEHVVLGVRPEDLILGEGSPVRATVSVIESLGHERHVICRLEDGQLIIVRQAANVPLPVEASEVGLTVDTSRLHVFDAVSEERVDA